MSTANSSSTDQEDLAALDATETIDEARVEQAMRWRLILGGFADERLGYDRLEEALGQGGQGAGAPGAPGALDERSNLAGMIGESRQMDGQLQYIYDREFAARSIATWALVAAVA